MTDRRVRLSATEKAARNDKALELHLGGGSYAAIAEAMGFSSKSTAYAAVQDALAARSAEAGQAPSEVVRLEVARLDAMLTGLWAKARRGDVAAVDRVLRISERRTHLMTISGAAAPAPAAGEGSPVASIAARRAQRLAESQPQ